MGMSNAAGATTVRGWITAATVEVGQAVLLPYGGKILDVQDKATEGGQVLLTGIVTDEKDALYLATATRSPFRPASPLYRLA